MSLVLLQKRSSKTGDSCRPTLGKIVSLSVELCIFTARPCYLSGGWFDNRIIDTTWTVRDNNKFFVNGSTYL